MANRIKLMVLGSTLAPYTSAQGGPQFQTAGAVSEYQSFDVSQLQRGVDSPASVTANYPHALSTLVVKYVNANHFQTAVIYVNSTQDQINSLANS